ncbi:MAG TPA: PAS domain-containing protein [Candidatus Sulfotelmatobacter sp.]|jgi:PAS domain S-box-containing protein|nr:PAS domain-containing protein [Candidatus Sulfotelmatobacter sp.]
MSQTGANPHDNDAEEASNDIEERLRLIIDTIPTIVWRKLPDGSADFLNRNFREYTGLSLEHGLGWGWMNAFHPDDRLMDEWRAALAAGKPFEKEARLRRADGQYRWFLIRAVPLRDEQGNIANWYGTTNDIDDRKRAEDRVRLIIDTLPMMVWTLRPNGVVDFVNQRWLDYTGLTLEEEIREPTRVVYPEDLPRVIERWLADMAAGEPSEDEMRLRRADGEYRWFLVRTAPLRDERGNVVKWFGVSIDIEDRKQAEEALRSTGSEQRHIAAQLERERARLVEAQAVAKMGSWEAELASLSVIWSEQTHRIFETDPSRFHPTRPKFREFIHPEDRAKVDGAFVASLGKRSPSTVEYRIIMPDGRVKVLEERWQAFPDEEGKPVRVAGTCRDITERVRAEEELQRLSGQLLRLQDEERRRIARDLHDSTGQDLVALATTVSQLQASIPSSSRKLRKLASQCQSLADRCIRDVRTLSYLLHPPMLDEAGLEDAIRHYAGGFTERTEIEVELEISPPLGRMKPHVELALFRVVQESLTNIQRHSGSPKATIRMVRNPGKFTLEISDQGSGISGSLRRRNGKMSFGLGVGIPSMHERVALIGGQLDIESSSSGTTVRVTIPADD